MPFAALGDLTGDGLDDFAAALSRSEELNPEPWAGGQYMPSTILFVAGREEWPPEVDLWTDEGVFSQIEWTENQGENFFASEMAPAGDVNGDGQQDLLLYGRRDSENVQHSYVVYGGSHLEGSLDMETLLSRGHAVHMAFRGFRTGDLCLSTAGDFNGDGYGDIAVGHNNGEENYRGITFVIPGGPDLPADMYVVPSPEEEDGILRIYGPGEETYSGIVVGPAADFNADGFDDLYVSSFDHPAPFTSPYHHYVVFGREEIGGELWLERPWGEALDLRGVKPQVFARGLSKNTGDLNADGCGDFAFSEVPLTNPTQGGEDAPISEGAVYVVFGLSRTTSFVRGDSDLSGELSITDPVLTLGYLFLGLGELGCEDAADSDDSGRLELTDAVYVLGYLFLGTAAPPPPFPEAGEDPTEDGLSCEGRGF
jgi:hypothetical protein